MINQARGSVDVGATPVPQVAKMAFKPAPLSKNNSEENQRAWQVYYESLARRTEAARAAQAKPSSSGTQNTAGTPVPSSCAASASTESQEGGGTQSRTSGSNKIPQPPKYEPIPPAADTPMEHVLTTRELRVVVDIGMLLASTSVAHQTHHPALTDPQDPHVHNQHMFDTQYPGIRVFAELILLGYLRSLHIAQESMCR
eukprot:3320981-Amphidinium_carterae.1